MGRRALIAGILALVAPAWVVACGAPARVATGLPSGPAPDAAARTIAPDAGVAALARVQILAFNDFHGNLDPPAGGDGELRARADDPFVSSAAGARAVADSGSVLVPAGGAAYFAAHVRRLRAENPATLLVSAGDLTGASPLVSNLFNDEPTILVMNRIGLDLEGLGNHDLDRGLGELLRLQRGCAAPCDAGAWGGAAFAYLAANVRSEASGARVLPPYAVKEVAGVKIGFVGVTLEATPTVTAPSAVRGLRFGGEAAAVNAVVPELRAQGVAAIVVLLHQGGFQAGAATYDACDGLRGEVLSVLAGDPSAGAPPLSKEVDVVVTAHTHQAYDCMIDGRLVTSAASYGRIITKIDLVIDVARRRVVERRARNVPVTRDVAPDPDVAALVASYAERAAPLARRVVGYVDGPVSRSVQASPSCETPLGDLVADAQLAATKDSARGNADVAFMNAGGLRADLVARTLGGDRVAYADAFEVQPFGNELVTMTLTGAQLKELLGAQFAGERPRVLQVSSGFEYAYEYDHAAQRATIDPRSIRVAGAPLDLARAYRVTVNSFLAVGGDGFAVLRQGTARTTAGLDLDALTAYLSGATAQAPRKAPRGASRIRGNGCR